VQDERVALRLAPSAPDPESEDAGALRCRAHDVVDDVRVHAGTTHQQAPELWSHLAQQDAREPSVRPLRMRHEHAQQRAVVRARGVDLVVRALAAEVLAQRPLVLRQRLDDVAVIALPARIGDEMLAGARTADDDRLVFAFGTPYRWGGTSPATGFDCSGFTSFVWRAGGKSLPRTSRAQYSATQRISAAQLQPGDLVFYGSPIHHVSVYIGGGQVMHSPRTGKTAGVGPLRNPSGYGRVA